MMKNHLIDSISLVVTMLYDNKLPHNPQIAPDSRALFSSAIPYILSLRPHAFWPPLATLVFALEPVLSRTRSLLS